MKKSVLRWNFVFQYGWVLTNVFNSILLLPLYVKNIDANTLGVWLATSSVLNWMTLADPGVGEVLQQNIAEYLGRKEYGEISKSIGSGLIASAAIVVFAIVVGFGCYFSIGLLIKKDITQYPHLTAALVITIIATGLSLVSFTLSGINQGLHNAANVAIASLSANFLFLFVNLGFLFLGFGVMSIAIANLFRALFINVYNIISMLRLLKKDGLPIIYQKKHFKRFIKIFSFTSASKIISGLSGSLDMLVLARFIPASMITMYEINKRPINLTNTLVGRHSVALMPLISHAKGTGDTESIRALIYKQFKFYSYAALFLAFIFCVNYNELITLWAGKGKFIGNTVLYLLVLYNFFALISYFMSNVGYALGDIKKNSQFNIVKNLIYGVLVYFGASKYGIIGAITVTLTLTFLGDFMYFPYKVYKLGYFQAAQIKSSLRLWAIIIPVSMAAVWGCKILVDKLLSADMLFSKLLIESSVFTLFFVVLLLLADGEARTMVKQLWSKILYFAAFRKLKTETVS